MSIAGKAKDKAKKNPNWLLGVLLLLHLIAISFNRSTSRPELLVLQTVLLTLTTPVQSGLIGTSSWFSRQWQSYIDLRGARGENDTLKSDRARLERELIEARERLKSFEQRDSLSKWQAERQWGSIPARVIGRDINHLFKTVIIDRGSTHGVQKDQPVVDAAGLVGRVIFVAPFSSRVILVSDERHGAGAILGITAEGRSLGIVRGLKDTYQCQVDFITPPIRVANGEQVITSGQDGIYPQGILIGWVATPADSSATIPQRLTLQPAAALGRLETVAVLQVTREQIRAGLDEVGAEEEKPDKAPPVR